jgi:hypothetical protein
MSHSLYFCNVNFSYIKWKKVTICIQLAYKYHVHTVNFPYICSNIPLSPAYRVYISQLIRYARACSTNDQFLSWGRLLTDKLMLQGFLQSRLMSAFHKFYGCYNDLIYDYKLSLSHHLRKPRFRFSFTRIFTLA